MAPRSNLAWIEYGNSLLRTIGRRANHRPQNSPTWSHGYQGCLILLPNLAPELGSHVDAHLVHRTLTQRPWRGYMVWFEPEPCTRQDLLAIHQKLQDALAEVGTELGQWPY
jgi:hypothetical protein